MHPAFSVISFTTLLGAAQGFIVTLALLRLVGVSLPHLPGMLVFSTALLLISLGASFLHLGRPERAWRAAAMWRTSWLSREVIVLPVFIAATLAWAIAEYYGNATSALPILIIVLSFLLWLCTAMIYACIRFIAEWSHPLTIINFYLLGIASGLTLLTAALAIIDRESVLLSDISSAAIVFTLAAMAGKIIALMRNSSLKPLSTLQSATGIRHPVMRQTSMGMSAGAFNTREFFHGKTLVFLRNIRSFMIITTFVAPVILLMMLRGASGSVFAGLAVLAFLVQYLGLLSERWLFFAQANHPQNLYYQVVS